MAKYIMHIFVKPYPLPQPLCVETGGDRKIEEPFLNSLFIVDIIRTGTSIGVSDFGREYI